MKKCIFFFKHVNTTERIDMGLRQYEAGWFLSILKIYILIRKDQVLKIIFIFWLLLLLLLLVLLFWQISAMDLESINVYFFYK